MLSVNSSKYLIVAFYKFVELDDLSLRQETFKAFCKAHEISGTLLLAEEGINGTLGGSEENVQALLALLGSDPKFSDLEYKFSFCDFIPFKKTKIKIKKEIVHLGLPDIKPQQKTAKHVPPTEWNALISDPDVLVIDTRNTYETELGSFKGAIDPKTRYFRYFPNYVKDNLTVEKHKKIAMFCTGGIRCEKASSYLLEQGFENVYQLQGGILKYLETMDPEKSLWQGQCFIFDDRITIEKESMTVL